MNADILQRQLVVAEGFLAIAKAELADVRAELWRTHEMWKAAADEVLRTRDLLKEVAAVLEQLKTEHETFYVDWALLNSESPDYDPAYKPEFPPVVENARAALEKVRQM